MPSELHRNKISPSQFELLISQVDWIDKKVRELQEDGKGLSGNILRLYENLAKVREHLVASGIKEIDLYLNIALNMVSFSLAFLIAFISVPALQGSWIPPIGAFSVALFIFLKLLKNRRKEVAKLSYTYVELMLEFIDTLQEKTEIDFKEFDTKH